VAEKLHPHAVIHRQGKTQGLLVMTEEPIPDHLKEVTLPVIRNQERQPVHPITGREVLKMLIGVRIPVKM
jgi:hypothetical protein